MRPFKLRACEDGRAGEEPERERHLQRGSLLSVSLRCQVRARDKRAKPEPAVKFAPEKEGKVGGEDRIATDLL